MTEVCRLLGHPVTVEVFRSPTGCLLRLHGQFTERACELARRLLAVELLRSPQLLTLDLSAVTELDATAEEFLTVVRAIADELHITLTVVRPTRTGAADRKSARGE
jgi:hypothetical protein